jgi:hypothetical protein
MFPNGGANDPDHIDTTTLAGEHSQIGNLIIYHDPSQGVNWDYGANFGKGKSTRLRRHNSSDSASASGSATLQRRSGRRAGPAACPFLASPSIPREAFGIEAGCSDEFVADRGDWDESVKVGHFFGPLEIGTSLLQGG